MATTILTEFDKLRKHIKTDDGKVAAKEFRKRLKRSEKYADKLDDYFVITLDGGYPEETAKSLKLIE
jgi:ribose 1,5-bisphosphokinase PhnN